MSDLHDKRRERLDDERRRLPDEPGVYMFSDELGEVLYVGKARSLRKRVNSYFTKSHEARIHALVMRIAHVEVFVLGSEREALLVEDKLVKQHKPPFNVMLRDDKSFPYIAVTLNDDFPRVLFTRERHRPGVRYFGPYSNAKRVRATLELLNRVFPYRPCEGRTPGRQSGVPCLDYHIERCAAPCVGYISREDYRAVIDKVMAVLSGRSRPIERELTEQMRAASAALEFERAAKIRNRLRALADVARIQAAEHPGQGSFDIVGVALGDNCANVQLLQVRDGRLVDRSSHYLDNTEGLSTSIVLTQFALAYYEPGRAIPPQIVIAHEDIDEQDRELLELELSMQRDARVEVRAAQRGERKRLAHLARRNAEHALRFDSIRERSRSARRAAALEALRDELSLESLPLRIECYDISNLQDTAAVASMVVFEDGRPRKDHYRKFSMRHEGGQDDFAMMAEVIARRFTRIAGAAASQQQVEGEEAHELAEHAADAIDSTMPASDAGVEAPPDEADGADAAATAMTDPQRPDADDSFDSVPNLVVIDGGKGQLGAAVEQLRELGIDRVAVCSLAKREEWVYLPGRSDPIVIDRHSPALALLQRIRDEAHRFALRYHRTKRSADQRSSILDALPDVGPARKRALLNFFGSPERVLAASRDELEAVPGLPGKVARRIYDELNRLGSTGSV